MGDTRGFDLVVAGSGFGGSLLALIACRIGLRTLLIERGSHPRFAIGESTSPLANLVLEQLCREYDIPKLAPLTSYGRWKRSYPDVGCGLKRGFTFYHHRPSQPFLRQPGRSNELLVAASPSDAVADTHWLRADTDHFFLQQAIDSGVEYVDRTQVQTVDVRGDSVRLEATGPAGSWTAATSFLVDATGPRGLLFRQLSLGEHPWPHLRGTGALFSHFENVPRLAPDAPGLWWEAGAARGGEAAGSPSVRAPTNAAPANLAGGCPRIDAGPYPAERAAVHHVFDGGWIWSLRFDSGLTSLGAAVRPWLARKIQLERGAEAWSALIDRIDSLSPLRQAAPVGRFDAIPSMPYRSAAAASYPWALLPGAAAFVDPFLSTGIPLTLLGIERLAELLKTSFRTGALDAAIMRTGLAGYERITFAEVDATSRLIAGCYAAFEHFELLSSYLMYYFAASSYAEVARRLDKPSLGGLFLRADDGEFQRAIDESRSRLAKWDDPCGEKDGHSADRAVPSDGDILSFRRHVRKSIERINVAGLEDPTKRNWYPVDLQDLVRTAKRFGMSSSEMESFVAKLEREAREAT